MTCALNKFTPLFILDAPFFGAFYLHFFKYPKIMNLRDKIKTYRIRLH